LIAVGPKFNRVRYRHGNELLIAIIICNAEALPGYFSVCGTMHVEHVHRSFVNTLGGHGRVSTCSYRGKRSKFFRRITSQALHHESSIRYACDINPLVVDAIFTFNGFGNLEQKLGIVGLLFKA